MAPHRTHDPGSGHCGPGPARGAGQRIARGQRLSVLDEDERAASGGGTALDATPVPLFSRGPSRHTGLCASDPDGGWYVREGDHREREDDKGKPLRKPPAATPG